MAIYDIGDIVRLSAAFTVSSVATDPTTLTFKVHRPDATTTTYVYGTDAQLVRASQGNYYVDYTVTQAGVHWYKFSGTGAAADVEEGYFDVRPSEADTAALTQTAYATLTEVANAIQLTPSVTDARVLPLIILAASNAIDRFCNRPDGFVADTTATARQYAGSGKPYQLIDECTSVTKVEVKDSVTDTTYVTWVVNTDYIPFTGNPRFPKYNMTPYTGVMIVAGSEYSIFTNGEFTTGRGGFARDYGVIARGVPTVQVTAKWGYATTVPDAVREACIIESARWYKRGQGAFSDALSTGSLGDLQFRRVLDLDVRDLLTGARLVRPNIGLL